MSKTCALGRVVTVSAGQPAPRLNEFGPEGKPFVRAGSLENLLNGGKLSDCEKVAEATATKRRLRLYPKDTIVFAKSGMSATLGRVYRLSEASYVVSHLAALVPTGVYDPSFLTHWLRSNPPSHLIKDPAYPSIRVSEIQGIKVPAVPLHEQERLATILDKADGIRRKREHALTIANDLLRSVFLEMFGDPVVNPRGWPVFKLGECVDEVRYGTSAKCTDDRSDGLPVLRIPNIVDGGIIWGDLKYAMLSDKEVERLRMKNGDVLFVRSNGNPEYIARCAVFESGRDCLFASYLIRVRFGEANKLIPRYVWMALSVPSYRRVLLRETKTTAGNFNISGSGLKSLRVPAPPLAAQREFEKLYGRLASCVSNLNSDLRDAVSLYGSLSQRAFRDNL